MAAAVRRDCTECGVAFESYHGTRLTCSQRCQSDRLNRLSRRLDDAVYSCTVCSVEFKPIRRNQKRCSAECTRRVDSDRTNRYNKAHREERKAYNQEWQARPRARALRAERQRGYRQTERHQRRVKAYNVSPKGRAVFQRSQAKRRAAKRGATVGVSIPTVLELLAAQGGVCANCGRQPAKVHLDHIMPLALGGQHVPENLQALCQPCNQRKSWKHPVQFAREEALRVGS